MLLCSICVVNFSICLYILVYVCILLCIFVYYVGYYVFQIVGESGLGKSTLVRSLFLTNLFGNKTCPPAAGEF